MGDYWIYSAWFHTKYTWINSGFFITFVIFKKLKIEIERDRRQWLLSAVIYLCCLWAIFAEYWEMDCGSGQLSLTPMQMRAKYARHARPQAWFHHAQKKNYLPKYLDKRSRQTLGLEKRFSSLFKVLNERNSNKWVPKLYILTYIPSFTWSLIF